MAPQAYSGHQHSLAHGRLQGRREMTRYDEPGTRRRVAYLLTFGLLSSIGVCVLFHLLSTIGPPPAFGKPGAPTSAEGWINAYATWSQDKSEYSELSASTLLSALGFALAFGIFLAPRLALRASLVLLNLCFAWTSHLLDHVSKPLGAEVTLLMNSQDRYFWSIIGLNRITASNLAIADLEALGLLAVVATLTLLLNLGKGGKKALLLSLQVVSLCVVVLGSEIAIFDYGEFYLHVTEVQVLVNVVPWFSNADLLLSGLAIFVACTGVLHSRLLRPQI